MAIKPQSEPDDDAGFEVVEHTADWALLVWGKDLDELFTFASAGMSSLMVADQDSLPQNIIRSITLEAFDVETLLVDWLSELAYWAEDEQLVFREFDVSITGDLLLSATRTAEAHKSSDLPRPSYPENRTRIAGNDSL